MGVQIDLSSQVQGILPIQNGGTGGLVSPQFADNETPGGTQNSSNTAFTLVSAPSPSGSLLLFKNGLLLVQGTDYTLTGSNLTLTVAPAPADVIRGWYRFVAFAITNGREALMLRDDIAVGIGLVLKDTMTITDAFSKGFVLTPGPLSDSLTMTDGYSQSLV